MIEISHLTKKYGANVAVNDLNLTLESGNIYGFLGPNGAGKSTTMNIITGYIGASSGEVKINGFDINKNPEEAKKCIGYLPEIPPVYGDMKVLEYLQFVAELKKIDKHSRNADIKQVMDLTKLHDVKDRLIKNLSKGYRQRVGLAQALIGMPEIIILDEPTVGLDPKQIIEIRDLILSLKEKHTVILSSHILQEISAVCDHVFIISKGNLVASDSMEHLESRMSGAQQLEVTVSGARSDVEQMKEIPGVKSCEITREISAEAAKSDKDEISGTEAEQRQLQSEEKAEKSDNDEIQNTEAEQILLQSEEKTADNCETSSVDVERTLQSEEKVPENENMEETSEQHVKTQNGEYHLSILAKENQDIRETVFRYCVAHELVLLELKVNTKTLEDVFLELTGSEEVHKA